jgi:hypothetical protein
MSVSRFLSRIIIALALMLLVAFGARAQYRAGIQGTVLDPQGAAVSGAKITVIAKETGVTQVAATNDSGVYSVNRLAPGLYTITVEQQGFTKKVVDNVNIISDQMTAVNVSLEIGQVSQSVTVNGAEIPAINTESGQIAGTVTSRQIQALPSFGRDVFQLAQLTPGVFGDAAQSGGGGSATLPGVNSSASGASDGIFKTENAPQIIANGAQQEANNITLDGVGITSVSWGGAAVITPTEDSVKEVKVISNNYDAEYGRYAGAQIQVTSQNGTNEFHGSAFFKNSQPGFNAYQRWNGPASDGPGTPEERGLQKDTAKFDQIGGSLGGPIWKNKIFAFFAYETIRNNSTTTGTEWFETPQYAKLAPTNSVASQFLTYPGEGASYSSIISNAATSCTGIGLAEYNAATKTGNCITVPGQGLDIGSPLTTPLGTSDPTWVGTTSPGVGGGLNPANPVPTIMDVSTTSPSSLTEVQYNGRLDFNITSKDLLAVSIYDVPVSSTSYNGPARSANLWHHDATNQAMTGLWDHTFSPTLLNEVRVNAAGWRWNEINSNPQEPWGLPTASVDNIGSANFSNNGYFGPPGPSVFDQWTYNVKDVATKVMGSHTIKFGGEVTRLLFVQEAPWSARPSYNFHNFWDFLNDAPYQENGTFDPITGIPASFRKDTRANILGFFIQDTYKFKPNLTFTVGLRYDNFGPLSEKNGNLSTLELGSTATTALTGMYFRKGGNLYNASNGDFGPQLGFAWSPGGIRGHSFNNKLVIRGGFGLGYTGEEEAITLNGSSNPPFLSFAPTLTGAQILYQPASSLHCFDCYPSNPYTLTTFSSNNIPVSGAPISGTGFPAYFPTPYTYRYSLQAQYDLGAQWIATLGYQGSSTHHLTRQYNLNATLGGIGIPLNPMISDVDWYANDANSNYNAFLAVIEHQFSRSFQFSGQYQYAKSMDQGSQPYNVDQYQYNPQLAWGPSDWDIRNAFKLWGVWQPQIFHSPDRNWMEKIVGGWSLSGIFNWHSGFPWTAVYSNIDGNNICNLVYNTGCGQPNGSNWQLRPATYSGTAGTSQGINTFKTQNGNFTGITTGTSGNAGAPFFTAPTYVDCALPYPQTCPIPQAPAVGRNSFRGPRYIDVDATISKSFGLPSTKILGEAARLEFRANFYNLFNNLKMNPTQMDNIVTDPYFGSAKAALGSRTMELQARFSF